MAKPEYIQKNKAWLEGPKSHEDGVHPLDRGVFYKVIKPEGALADRAQTPSSVVVAHYTGKTISKAFGSSRGGVAPAFPSARR